MANKKLQQIEIGFCGSKAFKEDQDNEGCEKKNEFFERLKAITNKAQRWTDSVKVLELENQVESFQAPLKEVIKLLIKLFYVHSRQLQNHQIFAFDQANQKIGKFLVEALLNLHDYFHRSIQNGTFQNLRSGKYFLAEIKICILSLLYDHQIIQQYHLSELLKERNGRKLLEKCFLNYVQSQPFLRGLENLSSFNMSVSLLKNKNSEGFLNLIGCEFNVSFFIFELSIKISLNDFYLSLKFWMKKSPNELNLIISSLMQDNLIPLLINFWN